jgi:hypothetical protein
VDRAIVCRLTKKLEILSILLDDISVKYPGPSNIPINGRGPGFAFALWEEESTFLRFLDYWSAVMMEYWKDENKS